MKYIVSYKNEEEYNLIQEILFSLGYVWYSTMTGRKAHGLRPYFTNCVIIFYNDRGFIALKSLFEVDNDDCLSLEEFLYEIESGNINKVSNG